MAIPGLIGGITGALTNPSVQGGIQSANNAVKGALTSLPGPIGGAYKNIFNTATSINNSMASNMGRIAQGALGGGLSMPKAPTMPSAPTKPKGTSSKPLGR